MFSLLCTFHITITLSLLVSSISMLELSMGLGAIEVKQFNIRTQVTDIDLLNKVCTSYSQNIFCMNNLEICTGT